MKLRQTLRNARQWDAARPSLPGEHWLVLGAGLLALRGAARSRSLAGRLLRRAVGGALIARAAAGRDGAVARLARLAGPATVNPLPAARGRQPR